MTACERTGRSTCHLRPSCGPSAAGRPRELPLLSARAGLASTAPTLTDGPSDGPSHTHTNPSCAAATRIKDVPRFRRMCRLQLAGIAQTLEDYTVRLCTSVR